MKQEPIQYSCDGPYAAHSGITDLYTSVREELQPLLGTGEPFQASGLSAKKELCSWSMHRETVGGPITITVSQWMDEGEDLVYDALPDGVELSDEQTDEILEAWMLGCDGSSEASETTVVPGDLSLDAVLEKVFELFRETSKRLDAWFELLKGTIKNRCPELFV